MRELMAHVRSELDFEYVEVIEPVHMPEVAEFFVRLTK